ncbi:unnamed protein product [Chironomus riparius]|uniref:Queuosine 5'-phosphate N-glycosylase/hydrolase n=1 Tax=Chironomus riparius TaxID=315576 RepID=A0A9N9S9D3_9DIPT|nr:unnamed protein product [Chironomus riparius]
MALSPKESGEFIVKNAKHLTVSEDGIKNLANQIVAAITDQTLSINNFSQIKFHPKSTDDFALNWIFLIDTLNFCFWTPDKQPQKWKVEGESGYFALCAAINRAQKEGIDVTNPKYYSKITLEQLDGILRPDDGVTKAPLLEDRVKCLHDVGTKLLDKYNGKFENVVLKASGSAKKLLEIIVDEFPCFRDEAEYCGKRVSILKRAQILVGDVYACYRGQGIGKFDDIDDEITMFADYRVPQVLVHFGSLTYSDELMQELKDDKILMNGEEKEVEIRGASIYIVEKAKEIVRQMLKAKDPKLCLKNVNSILIDHFLWDYRRANAEMLTYVPFHKTFSVYY